MVAYAKDRVETYARSDLSLRKTQKIGNKRATLRAWNADGSGAMYTYGDDVMSGTVGFWDTASGEHTVVTLGVRGHSPALSNENIMIGFEQRRRIVSIGTRVGRGSPVDYRGYEFLGPRTPALALNSKGTIYYGFATGIIVRDTEAHRAEMSDIMSSGVHALIVENPQSIYIGSTVGHVYLRESEIDNGQLKFTIKVYESPASRRHACIALEKDPSGRYLMSTHYDAVHVFDIEKKDKLFTLSLGETDAWYKSRWSDHTDYIWTLTYHGVCALYKLETSLSSADSVQIIKTPVRIFAHGEATAVRLMYKRGHIYIAWDDGTLQCYEEGSSPKDAQLLWEIPIEKYDRSALGEILDDGCIIMPGKNNLTIYDPQNSKQSTHIDLPSSVSQIQLMNQQQELLLILEDGHLQTYRLQDYSQLMDLPLMSRPARAMSSWEDNIYIDANGLGILELSTMDAQQAVSAQSP